MSSRKRRPPSGGPPPPKKRLTGAARESELNAREAQLNAREQELDAREKALELREAANHQRPPSVAPPPQAPPRPPPAAFLKICVKLNERLALADAYEAVSQDRRRAFLKDKGRSYEFVTDGRLLSVVRRLYDGHIERFYALFHDTSQQDRRSAVQLRDVLRVVRFLALFEKNLPAINDAEALLNAFRVRVCNAERMARVLKWLEGDGGEDIEKDVADDFSNRVTALLYETLPEPSSDGPPPASVLAPFLPQRQAPTTSDARRDAALDEKIQFFQDWSKAADSVVFLAAAHRAQRDVKAGHALHALKEAYAREGVVTFYSIFPKDAPEQTVVSVARLAAKLTHNEHQTFARVVWKAEHLREITRLSKPKHKDNAVAALRELLVRLEEEWHFDRLVSVMLSAGMPENPRPLLRRCIEHLPEFVEVMRVLTKPVSQRKGMTERVEALYARLLTLQKGVAVETRRNRQNLDLLVEPNTRAPQPLGDCYAQWISAHAYFELLESRLKACGLSDALFEKVHTLKVQVL